MWIAMLCSVTVSMGDETKGVFRVMRFVMGVSRVTSAAGKPREHVRVRVASHVPGDPLRTLDESAAVYWSRAGCESYAPM